MWLILLSLPEFLARENKENICVYVYIYTHMYIYMYIYIYVYTLKLTTLNLSEYVLHLLFQ